MAVPLLPRKIPSLEFLLIYLSIFSPPSLSLHLSMSLSLPPLRLKASSLAKLSSQTSSTVCWARSRQAGPRVGEGEQLLRPSWTNSRAEDRGPRPPMTSPPFTSPWEPFQINDNYYFKRQTHTLFTALHGRVVVRGVANNFSQLESVHYYRGAIQHVMIYN